MVTYFSNKSTTDIVWCCLCLGSFLYGAYLILSGKKYGETDNEITHKQLRGFFYVLLALMIRTYK